MHLSSDELDNVIDLGSDELDDVMDRVQIWNGTPERKEEITTTGGTNIGRDGKKRKNERKKMKHCCRKSPPTAACGK
ncbi:hypothetical protein D0Y65_010427 [Glycine soja]|uniref:Uncharacterized protein n=1 Tax=Glycine soja TaxID=3848 RepID=A0A445L3L3_GLYSO|nr:hypothetical protein D0Y65_010427 [Glycine soja]